VAERTDVVLAEPAAAGDRAAPVAERIRARWGKQGKIRFVSAIDLGRLWERALRKADLPIAYSEGFSPHPKVSFPDALPLGYASTGEYVELTFAFPVRLDRTITALNAAFPAGLAVLDAHAVADGAPKLAKHLRASLWTMDYRLDASGASPAIEALPAAVEALRAAERLPVERQRKGAPIEVDLRPAIHQISLTDPHPDAPSIRRITVVLHHLEPPVRPSEVHLALHAHIDQSIAPPLPEPALVTRVAQGLATDEGVAEALTGAHVAPAPPPPTP
jgi:radical SAM-linked protein